MHRVLQGAEAVKKHASDNDHAKSILKEISMGFLNAIHINSVYKEQITLALDASGDRVAYLFRHAEKELNTRILDAKHKDTRAKRLKEKALVLSFYKKHRDDLANLFKLDKELNKKSIHEEVKEGLAIPPESLNISRSIMPQIKGDQLNDYLSYLKDNDVDHRMVKVAPKHLRATQSEFNLDKVQSMIDTDGEYKPPLISKDFYILDGHHRWLADYNKNKEDPVPVRMIDSPILDLMSLTHRFSGVMYKPVTEQKNHK